MAALDDAPQSLSLSAEERLEPYCARFEAAWQTGSPPLLEDFLAQVAVPDRPHLLRELLRLDLHYRLKGPTAPTPSEYLRRFPNDAALVREELDRAVAAGGPPPTVPGYEVLEELGRGGMGVVYKARQRNLNRLVALKMLHGGRADPRERARFQAEAEAVARLQHPNIVQVHEVGECEGRPFFSMECCAGGSLATRLAGTPLPIPEAATLVETLARAVQHAHQHGVVHRDLKPSNVLLMVGNAEEPSSSASPIPKINDFGLAKRLDGEPGASATGGQTAEDVVLGTPPYMAPEQAAGRSKDVGGLADVYALGAILYECLTGRPPFKAATAMETLWQVLNQDPASVGQLNHAVPRDLETICLKCLEKDPRRRYRTAEEVADDLRRFLERKPIQARPASVVERALKWARRRPAVAALLVVCAMAFAVVSWQLAVVVQADREMRALRREAERRLTLSHLDRALALLEQGDASRGVLVLAQTLERVHEEWFTVEEAVPLQQAIRVNLAAWLTRTHSLENCIAHPAGVLAASFSPDGRSILTVGDDGQARLWDAGRGTQTRRLLEEEVGHEVLCAAFHPDGRLLILGQTSSGRPRLWIEQGSSFRFLDLAHQAPGEVGAISPDGRLVATSEGKSIQVWKVHDGKPSATLLGCQGQVRALAFNSSGDRLAASDDKLVRVWDLSGQGELLWTGRAHRYAVRTLCFGPDGILASGSADHTAWLWDVRTGAALGKPLEHEDSVLALCFSGDGKRLLAGSADGTAALWDVRSGRRIGPPLEHQDAVWATAFSPKGETVLAGTRDGSLRLWKPAREALPCRELSHEEDQVMAAALSPDPSAPLLVTGGSRGMVRVWNVQTGERLFPRPSHSDKAAHADDVWAVSFSPDGRLFATGSRDETVKIWDANRFQVVRTLNDWNLSEGEPGKTGSPRRVRSLAFSPDGRHLLVGGGGGRGTAVLWQVDGAGRVLHEGDTVWQVAFSPDGQAIALATGDGSVSLQRPEGESMRCFGPPLRQQRRVNALTFSPDGRLLLAGGIEGVAQVWDVRTGGPVGKPLRHPGAVWSAAFLDEHTALTGCRDGGGRLWDVRTGLPIGSPLRHGGVVWAAACRPGGRLAVTGSEDGTARVWQLPAAMEGGASQILRRLQVLTGLGLDERGPARLLDVATWHERRQPVP
jgi:WD40 repeat protein/tRNA A-37 threonylcarbamoyl transferase component Bud32